MEVDDWVVVVQTEFNHPLVGRLGKIVRMSGKGDRFGVEFDVYGPIVWFHRSQIKPHLDELRKKEQ